MPEATLKAVADHGEVRGDTIHDSYAASHKAIDDLAKLGIDMNEVADLLERQGVDSFEKSWEELIASVTEQIKKAAAATGSPVKAAAE